MAFFRDYKATGTLTYKQRFLFISTVPIYFMIFALIFSPIKEILPGLWQIIIQPDLLITDYIVVGGIGAAFSMQEYLHSSCCFCCITSR